MGAVFRWISDCFAAIRTPSHARKQDLKIRHLNTGQLAEKLAARYLARQGLKLIKKNYSTKAGEIDLIMRHDQCLVFVEVKYRKTSDWAQAVETVTPQKQRRIIKAAQQFLQQTKMYDQIDCRFDVIAIDDSHGKSKVNWIKHAFY